MGTPNQLLPERSFKGMSLMALPIILANASIPLLGVADTAVVARLGQTEALAAVAAGATILFFLLWAFGFLRMTTSALTGQAVGAKRVKEPALILVRAMGLAISLGILLALLGGLTTDAGLKLLGVEENVATLVRRYLNIAFWAAPGQLIIFVVHGWLLGHGKSGFMFLLSLGIGGMNLGLNWLMTLHWGWGIEGLAIATVMSSSLGAVIGVATLVSMAHKRGYGLDRQRLLDIRELRGLATLNANVMVRTILLIATFTAFNALSARLGTDILAAHAVLLHFVEVTAYALDGIADVVESYAARFWGAKKIRAAQESLLRGMAMALVVSLLMGIGLSISGPFLIALVAPINDVAMLAKSLGFYAYWIPLIGFSCYMLDGYFFGLAQGATIRNAMIFASLAYGFLLVLVYPEMGPEGLWLALWGLFVFRAASLALVVLFRHPKVS